MTNPTPENRQANNLTELDDEYVAVEGIDPLTDTRTVAQTPTADEDIRPLPEVEMEDGQRQRAGDYDPTTGAAHPSADSGADRGNESLAKRLEEKLERHQADKEASQEK